MSQESKRSDLYKIFQWTLASPIEVHCSVVEHKMNEKRSGEPELEICVRWNLQVQDLFNKVSLRLLRYRLALPAWRAGWFSANHIRGDWARLISASMGKVQWCLGAFKSWRFSEVDWSLLKPGEDQKTRRRSSKGSKSLWISVAQNWNQGNSVIIY